MGTVFTMRFNREQAAIIADESTWHLGIFYDYRRSNYGDAILPLFCEESEGLGRRAGVYAGVGFPSFHEEVARLSRSRLQNEKGQFARQEQCCEAVQQSFQSVHRRYVDDRMNFHFYLGLDDLNARKIEQGERSLELKQDAVIREARKISGYGERGDAMSRIFDNSGLYVGYDEENGIQGQVLSPGYMGIAFSSFVTVIGHGNAAANQIVDRQLTRQLDLHQRRAGFSLQEGLHHFLRIVVETGNLTNKMGGYYQIVILDMKQKETNQRLREIADHRSRLCAEIIQAEAWGYLDAPAARQLLEDSLLADVEFSLAEAAFRQRVRNWDELQLRLFGFRSSLVSEMKEKGEAE